MAKHGGVPHITIDAKKHLLIDFMHVVRIMEPVFANQQVVSRFKISSANSRTRKLRASRPNPEQQTQSVQQDPRRAIQYQPYRI